jgi:hypothetical protein
MCDFNLGQDLLSVKNELLVRVQHPPVHPSASPHTLPLSLSPQLLPACVLTVPGFLIPRGGRHC